MLILRLFRLFLIYLALFNVRGVGVSLSPVILQREDVLVLLKYHGGLNGLFAGQYTILYYGDLYGRGLVERFFTFHGLIGYEGGFEV